MGTSRYLECLAADYSALRAAAVVAGMAAKPGLSDGPSLARQVLVIAGLHWAGYAAGGSPGAIQIRS